MRRRTERAQSSSPTHCDDGEVAERIASSELTHPATARGSRLTPTAPPVVEQLARRSPSPVCMQNKDEAAAKSSFTRSPSPRPRTSPVLSARQDFAKPTKSQHGTARPHGRSDMHLNDMLWICEQSFHREAQTLGKEILGQARTEFQRMSRVLLQELQEPVESLSGQLLKQVQRLAQQLEEDMVPLRERLGNQSKALQQLEACLSEHFARVLQEVHGTAQQREERTASHASIKIQEVRKEVHDLQLEVMRRSERQVDQVVNLQQAMSSESALVTSAVRDLEQELQRANARLVPTVEAQLCKHVHERPVTVDFDQVHLRLSKAQERISAEVRSVVGEVTTMKHELAHDVVREMETRHRSVHSMLEQLAERRKKAASHEGLRDSSSQTEAAPLTERSAQTDRVVIPKKRGMSRIDLGTKEKAEKELTEEKVMEERKKKQVFADGEEMKKRARQALTKPPYDVCNFYKDEGLPQRLAKSWVFENFTFLVILLNAIWIAIDVDWNDAAVLVHAKPVFQVMENLFCVYFTAELLVRFLAFRQKKHCWQDFWFVFDFVVLLCMIVETWLITLIMLFAGATPTSLGDPALLRPIRIVKIVRLSRMARLLRAIPELVVLLKAVGSAGRSLLLFFLLWLILIYIFAVVFRQLTEGNNVGLQYFRTVPSAMNTLLLEGILPENAQIMYAMSDQNPVYWPIMMAFILLASVTLMYMLIGVLVRVIAMVASTEKEGMVVSLVANRMRAALHRLGHNDAAPLSKLDFQELLVQPEVDGLCHDIGVNVLVLLDMSDAIYDSVDKDGNGMSFEGLIEVVLNMRGTNPATVKDMKEQLCVIKGLMRECQHGVLSNVAQGFEGVSQQMEDLQRMLAPGAGADDSSSSEASSGWAKAC